MTFDVIVRNALWFDGTGAAPSVRTIGVRGGLIAAVSEVPLDGVGCAEVIDADGKWLVPGFVDVHTHYDAEVLLDPGLRESVCHGVTTVVLGNCSLSTVYASPEDAADLFSRVEAVPREYVLDALKSSTGWSTPDEYIAALEALSLGPNVSSMIGHSDIRASVMGLGRATDAGEAPTDQELEAMAELLDEAMAAGMLGMSGMDAPIDKIGGDRYRSRGLPSTYARWRERRRLITVLRNHDRVLQSAPNIVRPWTGVLYFTSSAPLLGLRKAVRMSLLVSADSKANPIAARLLGPMIRLANRVLGSQVRFQHLPVPFELYSDGIDLPVFEEFGSGTAALHLRDQIERNTLLADPAYRTRFRKEFERRPLGPRMWHRDLHDAVIVECPNRSLVGKSFGQIADERGAHPLDTFLDILVDNGERNVRWRTTVANHRPSGLNRLAADPAIHMGFSDAGAHLRNMAFYNYSLRLLKRVQDAAKENAPFLTPEAAIHRLTAETADWFGLDAGTLRLGDRADFALLDPKALDATVDEYHEEPVPFFGGLRRMVNRNDLAVAVVAINGTIVCRHGQFTDGYGDTLKSGRYLFAKGHTPQAGVIAANA